MKQLEMSPHELRPNPWNTNSVDPVNMDKLKASMKRLGCFKPIIVREVEESGLMINQIIGGEHRWKTSIDLGFEKVPVINMGEISDAHAKEISIVDNGRYGTDNHDEFIKLIESIGAEDIIDIMPLSSDELEDLMSGSSDDDLKELEDLTLADMEIEAAPEKVEKLQSNQVVRFKVPMEDAGGVKRVIDNIKKEQGFKDSDALTNAGDALVFLCAKYEELTGL